MLGDHVQADRRLVEEQDLRAVQQGGDEFHLHPLAQRQFADRPAQQAMDVEHLGQAVAGFLELLRVDVIDMLVQPKRLGGRQVPPELVFLAHHQGEAAAVGVFAFPGHVAHHRRRAAGGGEHAGEQLERGRLARPVGPQKGDEFARLDRQINARDGLDGPEIAMKQPANRRPESLFLLKNAVRLRQLGDFDNRHGKILY